jgi:hypothetical protein
MVMKKTVLLTIIIMALYMSMFVVVPVVAEDADGFQIFPLPILDKLPNVNQYFYPGLDKCCKDETGIFGDRIVENPYKVKLPNGFNLIVSDWDTNSKIAGNQFSLIEDTIFVENRDGVRKAIAVGQGWGDPMQTLILDTKNKRIYISESQGSTKEWGDLVTREYDLKCSDTECFFIKTEIVYSK